MESPVKDSLYRILPFHRLVQILKTGRWYFAHPSEWEDPYEVRRTTKLSPYLFSQCWCRTAVSDAMWRIYSNDGLGVRIRVSQAKLQARLEESAESSGFKFLIRKVKYIKQTELTALEAAWTQSTKEPSFAEGTTHLFRKRLPFDHEAETRVVILDKRHSTANGPKGYPVHLEPTPLIESIFLDPRAPTELTDALRHYLKNKMLFPGHVAKSSLYKLDTRKEAQ